jgi:hypothetical protein
MALWMLALPVQAQPLGQGGRGVAQLEVSVQVRPVARLEVLRQVTDVLVTEGDVQRGYVEIRGASVLSILHNTPYFLVFDGGGASDRGSPFVAAEVGGLGAGLVVASVGTSLVRRPLERAGKETIGLRYRLILAPDARPGVFSFPLRISVRPA